MGSHLFMSYSLSFFLIIVIRYLLVAGLTWCLFYFRTIKLGRDASHDVRLSIVSAGIFSLIIAAAMELDLLDQSRICYQVCAQDAWYIAGSYLVVLILQDAFFMQRIAYSIIPSCISGPTTDITDRSTLRRGRLSHSTTLNPQLMHYSSS